MKINTHRRTVHVAECFLHKKYSYLRTPYITFYVLHSRKSYFCSTSAVAESTFNTSRYRRFPYVRVSFFLFLSFLSKEILYVYRISYVWYSMIACVLVVLVGIIVSLITGELS